MRPTGWSATLPAGYGVGDPPWVGSHILHIINIIKGNKWNLRPDAYRLNMYIPDESERICDNIGASFELSSWQLGITGDKLISTFQGGGISHVTAFPILASKKRNITWTHSSPLIVYKHAAGYLRPGSEWYPSINIVNGIPRILSWRVIHRHIFKSKR